MSRLHPRQRLIREATAIGVSAVAGCGYAIWWLCAPIRQPDTASPMPTPTIATASPVAQPTPPAGALWRPLSDTPVASTAPPPPPTFRLITLSQRQGAWMALVDPGSGAPTERIRTGDTLAGWQAVRVDADGVEFQSGSQHHTLRLNR